MREVFTEPGFNSASVEEISMICYNLVMYSREILPKRSTPIENGKPLQGTWTRAFDEVDLLDIVRPYSHPLPRRIRDFRIKEWETFFVQDDRFLLFVLLCNIKICCYASVILYDKENKERLWFKKTIPGSGWRLPRNLKNASVDSRSWGFFFRAHSWLDADTVTLDLDIEASRKRPSFTAHVEFCIEEEQTTPMAVSLLFSEYRSMYAYKAMTPVRGDMVFGGRHISLDPDRTTGIFGDFKGFYPYPMISQWGAALGKDGSNRRIGFSLGENQAKESYKNNENALWVDGQLSPLPPVKITRARGTESGWVIQDMEGMVDLVFTPKEAIRYKLNLFLPRSYYESPLGIYNGMVVNSEGEQIPLKNIWGLGEKVYLRV